MQTLSLAWARRCSVAVLAAALGASAAWAEKPDWAGGGGKGRDRGDEPSRQMQHPERDARRAQHERGPRREAEYRGDREQRPREQTRQRRDEREWREAREQRDYREQRDHGQHRDRRDHRDARDRRERRPVVVVQPGSYFNDGQRRHVHQWYDERYRAGHCPPGLAKKHNGCMPPGHARRWAVGRPLPTGVVYYPVPQPLLLQLGAAPAGYRYVRVAGDILLMDLGTRVVIDAVLW